MMILRTRAREITALLLAGALFANCNNGNHGNPSSAPAAKASPAPAAKSTKAKPADTTDVSKVPIHVLTTGTNENLTLAPLTLETLSALKTPIQSDSKIASDAKPDTIAQSDVVADGDAGRLSSETQVVLLAASGTSFTIAFAANLEHAGQSIAKYLGNKAETLQAIAELQKNRKSLEALRDQIRDTEARMKDMGKEEDLFNKKFYLSQRQAKVDTLSDEIGRTERAQVEISRAEKSPIGVSDKDRKAFQERFFENSNKLDSLNRELAKAQTALGAQQSEVISAEGRLLKTSPGKLLEFNRASALRSEAKESLQKGTAILEVASKSVATKLARGLSGVFKAGSVMFQEDGAVILKGITIGAGVIMLAVVAAQGVETDVAIHNDSAMNRMNVDLMTRTNGGDLKVVESQYFDGDTTN